MKIGYNSLMDLAKIKKDVKRKRVSSYDKTGANADFIVVDMKISLKFVILMALDV